MATHTQIPMTDMNSEDSDMNSEDSDGEDNENVKPMPFRMNVYSIKRKNVRKPLLPNSSSKEDKVKNFMKSVRYKDVRKVTEDLQADPKLTSYINDFGVSAIEEAVKSKSCDILKVFIEKSTERNKIVVIEHSLLYAIKENLPCVVEYLLKERANYCDPLPKKSSTLEKGVNGDTSHSNRPKKATIKTVTKAVLKFKNKTWADRRDAVLPGFEDAEYAPFITPIILAAKLERVAMIKLLLEYEASEIHPMTMECPFEEDKCEICIERKVFKSRRDLEDSNRLLEVYRALSSPAYIFQSGVEDPILEVFELSREMENMKSEDPSFKSEYEEIGRKCENFARQLLDLCRSSHEVKVLLEKSDRTEDETKKGYRTTLCGVERAINFNQKEFIAHPYCQQVLQKEWYEGLPEWVCNSQYFFFKLFLYILLWIPFWPIGCILFMLKIIPSVIRFMKYPINKFITDTLSYLFFLGLLIANDDFYHEYGLNYTPKDHFSVVEYLLIIWIIGMSARQIKLFYRHRYSLRNNMKVKVGVRWDDSIMLSFFWVWIIIRVAGIIDSVIHGTENIYRHHWSSYHPILISEAFFAVGTILSFVRVTGLFKAISWLGPLQISLRKMTTDIVRFLIIFVIVMTGFVVAITKIYSTYDGSVRIERADPGTVTQICGVCDGSIHVEKADTGAITKKYQENGYIGFENTAVTLFWNIFNYGELFRNADIVVNTTSPAGRGLFSNFTMQSYIGNGTNITKSSDDVIKHKFTEGIGYFLLAAYHIVVVVVLLNMLIAMMANSYNNIERNADKEWKFARTRLQMTYFNDVGSLPPPFNIAILGSVMKGLLGLCKKCSRCCRERYQDQTHKSKYDDVASYHRLMQKINKRYWNWRNAQQKKEITINTEDLEKLLREHNDQDS